MSKFDRKKFREDLQRKAAEGPIEVPSGDLSSVEIFFHKLSVFIKRNRIQVFSAILGIVVVIVLIISITEYIKYRENVATVEIEKIEKKHLQNPLIDIKDKIKDYEKYQKDFTLEKPFLRSSKVLSELYAKNGEFSKAAIALESAGKKIEDSKEIKAYYFYIAGNYRERANEMKEALQNYGISNSLLTPKDTPSFSAWSLYSTARLKLLTGDKEGAKKDLAKVLEIDSPEFEENLKSVKELATYLIIKLNKG
ncbi:MAG: hypothetical protein L6Q54_05490 [Leptospiraceae bacterium]|nr:hypothetical protein [Leptospiraceae bacterium]MCK6380691.1 hypothetical protein [Leptospiraceae bacterium]